MGLLPDVTFATCTGNQYFFKKNDEKFHNSLTSKFNPSFAI
jgi:hypothetical protein